MASERGEDAPLPVGGAAPGARDASPPPSSAGEHAARALPVAQIHSGLTRQWCTHTGAALGALEADDTSATPSFALLSAAHVCLQQALARHCPGGWQPQPPHPCNADCPWVVHGDVHMCAWSGNFHFCTADACRLATDAARIVCSRTDRHVCDAHFCDLTQEAAQARVCPLTGAAYPLDYRGTYHDQGVVSSESLRLHRVESPARRRRRRNGPDGMSIVAAPTTPTPTNGVRPTPVMRQLAVPRIQEHFALTGYVRRYLPSFAEARRAAIVDELLEAYARVKTTTAFRTQSRGNYTLEAHCLVGLFAMAQSGVASGAFIRAHVDVRDAMPSLARLDIAKAHRARYKRNTKQLSAFAHEWCRAHTTDAATMQIVTRGRAIYSLPPPPAAHSIH